MVTGADIVREAETWIGTPFRHAAGVKGQGADCGLFVLRVMQTLGLVPAGDPPAYPPSWCLHRGEDRFAPWLDEHADRVAAPAPGDVATFAFGRAGRAHLAIVVQWPRVLHADTTSGVVRARATAGPLAGRVTGFYRPRGLG